MTRTLIPIALISLAACGTHETADGLAPVDGPQVVNNAGRPVPDMMRGGATAAPADEVDLDQAMDIIVHVDPGAEMVGERDILADEIRRMLPLIAEGLDWRLLIINDYTGCSPNGIITWRTPRYMDAIDRAVHRLPSDPGLSHMPLANVSQAVANSVEGCNAGLLRSEAALEVLVLSHRDDQSFDHWGDLLDDVVDMRLGDVRFSTVSGYDTPVFEAVVTETGGVSLNIDGDWWLDLDLVTNQDFRPPS